MATKKTTSPDRILLFNRIATALAVLGMFDAGTLTAFKWINVAPPCLASGCALVETHPSSVINLGFLQIPVALMGFLAYLTLATLSVLRQTKGMAQNKPMLYLGYAISAAGMIISIGYTYFAFTVIQAYCLWCLGSLATMTVLFFVHAGLAQMDIPEDMPAVPDFKLNTALLGAFVLGLGLMTVSAFQQAGSNGIKSGYNAYTKLPWEDFIPRTAHSTGQRQANVQIVEFGDLVCPSCKANYPKIHDALAPIANQIGFTYRHMPMVGLKGHELALTAAVLAEIAGEKGKFYEYVGQVYALQDAEPTLDDLTGIARALNALPDNWQDRVSDSNDPAFQRVYNDLQFANAQGVAGTPTFFLLVKGQPNVSLSAPNLLAKLKDKDFMQSIGITLPPQQQQ